MKDNNRNQPQVNPPKMSSPDLSSAELEIRELIEKREKGEQMEDSVNIDPSFQMNAKKEKDDK
jgi:hypothetical protein